MEKRIYKFLNKYKKIFIIFYPLGWLLLSWGRLVFRLIEESNNTKESDDIIHFKAIFMLVLSGFLIYLMFTSFSSPNNIINSFIHGTNSMIHEVRESYIELKKEHEDLLQGVKLNNYFIDSEMAAFWDSEEKLTFITFIVNAFEYIAGILLVLWAYTYKYYFEYFYIWIFGSILTSAIYISLKQSIDTKEVKQVTITNKDTEKIKSYVKKKPSPSSSTKPKPKPTPKQQPKSNNNPTPTPNKNKPIPKPKPNNQTKDIDDDFAKPLDMKKKPQV